MNKSISCLILSMVLLLFILIGCFSTYLFNKKKLKKKIDFILGSLFSITIMLEVLYLFPEVYNCLKFKYFYLFLIFFVVGFIIMKVVDNYLPNHDNNKLTRKELKNNYVHIAIMISIILTAYNIIIGMELYNTILKSTSEAANLTVSISIRNVVLTFLIYSLLIQGRISKSKKALPVILLGLANVIGTIIMILINTSNAVVSGILFSTIMGMFLYFIIYELYRKVIKNIKNGQTIGGIIFGIVLILICSII